MEGPTDLIGDGFLRSPPAVLEAVSGPVAGRSIALNVEGWSSQSWRLDEFLQPIDDAPQAGLCLTCVDGSFYIAGTSAESLVWLHMAR